MSGTSQYNYRVALLLIIALAFIPMMVSADVFIHPPAVITSPGTYVLQSGLSNYGGPGPAVRIQSNDVVLDGNSQTLDGIDAPGSVGIVVDWGYQRVHVKDVRVTDFEQGIFYVTVGNGLVENCVAQSNYNGIALLFSNNINVRDNLANSNGNYGIASAWGTDNIIEKNTASQNLVGVYSIYSLRENISHNKATSNSITGIWYLGNDGIIDENDASNNQLTGIAVRYSDDTSISNNTVHNNYWLTGLNGISIWGSPPLVFDPTGLNIDNNTVDQNGNGIKLEFRSHDNNVTNNSVFNNHLNGIELRHLSGFWPTFGNRIDNNSVGDNLGYGIVLYGAPLNIISNNTIDDNVEGIVLYHDAGLNSNNNLVLNNTVIHSLLPGPPGIGITGIRLEGISAASRITGNTIDSNLVKNYREGIFLRFAQGNTILNNTIIGNTIDGMWLSSSQFNTIYNNCFNNSVNVAFDPITILPNNWNTLIAPGPNIVGGMYFGGNYWAKPDGTGHSQVTPPNADEFSNAALSIAAGNTDNFPLWNPLQASFTVSDTSGNVPLTVNFTDTSTGNPTCWYWDLDGDGSVDSYEQNPNFTYTAEGIYTITLTVSRCDVEGCAASSTYVDWIIVGPHADFTASPVVGPAPLTVAFTDLSTPTVTEWSWQYRPNGTIPWTQFNTSQNPLFKFVTPGKYDIRLNVTGIIGLNSSTKYKYIDVRTPFGPVCDFTASSQSGDAPLTVDFIDLSYGNVTSWSWDFTNDGTPDSIERNPSHTYTTPGVYTVNLTVTNPGGTNSKTLDITVTTPALMADFTASPQFGDVPLTVDFIDLSIGNVTNWYWDFTNDGIVDSTDRSPSHTYTTAGDYTVNLTVTDALSTDTKTLPIHVATPMPVANFLASPRTGYTDLEVFFYDRTTGTTSTTTYLWDFDDGGTSTERDPKHTYTAEGTYAVTLTVTNPGPPSFTETDSITKTDYIVVSDEPIPVATILSGSEGDVPFTVDFTSVSTYSPITWLWNFGDGASANQQNVTHTFLEPGVYDVTLRVFDEQGRGTQDTVAVTVRPVANFIADPAAGDAPLTVQFTDTSSGNPDYFEWSFTGAWIDSYQENPTHTYQDPGTYNVWHRVRANGVLSTWYISQVSVGSTPAIIADPTSGPVPLTVSFEGISGGYPVDWLWEFGNGHYQVGSALATYTYTETGVYTVTLTAYYNDRDPVNTTQIIKVGPVADFTMTPGTGNAPLTVQFTDTSLGTIANYHWMTSDGWTSTAQNPSHTFTSSGCHYVWLTVETPEGLTDTKETTIAVYPTADFTWYPAQGEEPLTVQFIDTSLGGGFLSIWDFGDGTNATFWDTPGRSAPVHIYQQLGTYQVSLTRMGYDALPNTTTKEVNLLERPPVADFTGVPRAGSAPHVVDFTDLSSGVSPMTYLWQFGDGGTSTAKNPSHTYTANGDYTVTLTVTNAGGPDTETKAAYIRVSDVPLPFAEFTASPRDGIEDLTVQFLDKSGNSPTSWLWQFGDGSTSTLQSPLHTYTTPGWYNVILTVSNAQGQNSIAKSSYIYVRNTPPVAAFDASPRSGDAPLTVQFSDQSAGLGITSWQWNFGDGSTSTTQNPLYVYNTAGTYTVTLTVANDGGSDFEVKNAYITVNPAQEANLIKLYPGWNFVSVPKKLASGQNTAIQVFGSVDLGGRAILLWDASTGYWKQVMAGDIVRPLNGYWVYSVTRIDVPLMFDTSTPPAPTSKELYAGWNAIGYTGTTSMSARNFLTLTGGLNGNWDILLGFSQGINPDVPIIRDSNDGLPMYPTKGYWIAMNTDDTLTVVV